MKLARLISVLIIASLAGAVYGPQHASSSVSFRQLDGTFADPAIAYCMAAPVSFRHIFGHWPGSWKEVVDSGLIQVQLLNHDARQVDPGDNSLDFQGDVHYVPGGAGQPPKIAIKDGGGGGGGVQIISLLPGADITYDTLISDQGPDFRFAALAQDHKAQTLIGMQRMLQVAIKMYERVQGHQPTTWAELRDSGLAPYDDSSINPVTGQPLLFDGSAFNMKVAYYEPMSACVIQPVGQDGEPLWAGSVF